MGLTYANLQLSNPSQVSLAPVSVKALVDTGALHLCIPQHLAIQLKLTELEKREVVIASGERKLCSYCWPLRVQFESRSCFVGALILGDEVLLGAIPMEDMDILVQPSTQKLIVHPDSPNIAVSTAKSLAGYFPQPIALVCPSQERRKLHPICF